MIRIITTLLLFVLGVLMFEKLVVPHVGEPHWTIEILVGFILGYQSVRLARILVPEETLK